MKHTAHALTVSLLGLLLAACSNSTDSTPGSGATGQDQASINQTVEQAIKQTVKQATQDARSEIARTNVRISDDAELHSAEITPQNQLLIDGKPMVLTPSQQDLVAKYRAHVLTIADAAVAVGLQGADLGIHAAKDAVLGALTGRSEQAEQRLAAEAEKLKVQAATLCRYFPALRASHDALAAALPAFQPFTRLNQIDIEHCDDHAASASQRRQ